MSYVSSAATSSFGRPRTALQSMQLASISSPTSYLVVLCNLRAEYSAGRIPGNAKAALQVPSIGQSELPRDCRQDNLWSPSAFPGCPTWASRIPLSKAAAAGCHRCPDIEHLVVLLFTPEQPTDATTPSPLNLHLNYLKNCASRENPGFPLSLARLGPLHKVAIGFGTATCSTAPA